MAMVRRPYVTTRTHQVFAIAHDLADALGHDSLSPVHVVLALLREEKNVGAQLLCTRAPRDVLERDLGAELPQAGVGRQLVIERAWSTEDEHLLAQAWTESRELRREYLGCEHVLLAVLRDSSSVPAQVLARRGIQFSDIRAELVRWTGG
jgi:ATP-dependent Clp protease ATP-binding subunit ClpC